MEQISCPGAGLAAETRNCSTQRLHSRGLVTFIYAFASNHHSGGICVDVLVTEFLKLKTLSSGRRTLALRKMRRHAQSLAFDRLVTHIDACLDYEAHTRELDSRWRTRQLVPPGSETKPIDGLVDRTIAAIRDGAVAQAQGALPDDPIIAKVDAFLGAIFPHGVPAITNLPHADELAAVEDILGMLQGELAPLVVELGLTRLVERLARLARDFRAALVKSQDILRFDTVREARARGQSNLIEAVALILGRYYRMDDPEHAAARALLLGPVIEQQEAVRAYARARRPVEDVDPDTGELDPGLPGPSPMGAGRAHDPSAAPAA